MSREQARSNKIYNKKATIFVKTIIIIIIIIIIFIFISFI